MRATFIVVFCVELIYIYMLIYAYLRILRYRVSSYQYHIVNLEVQV